MIFKLSARAEAIPAQQHSGFRSEMSFFKRPCCFSPNSSIADNPDPNVLVENEEKVSANKDCSNRPSNPRRSPRLMFYPFELSKTVEMLNLYTRNISM